MNIAPLVESQSNLASSWKEKKKPKQNSKKQPGIKVGCLRPAVTFFFLPQLFSPPNRPVFD